MRMVGTARRGPLPTLQDFHQSLTLVNDVTVSCDLSFNPWGYGFTPARTCFISRADYGFELTVEPINARSMSNAAAAAAADTTGNRPPVERRRRLSPAALAVTNQKVRAAYSPIVIAGAVRVADFVMLSLVGIAIYFGYVARLSGFNWQYIAAILGMAVAAVMCFQAADIYEVQVFRGQLRQM